MVGDHRVKEEEGGQKMGDEGGISELNETWKSKIWRFLSLSLSQCGIND